MKNLNQTEMSSTLAAGCGWIKRMAKRAARGGDADAAATFIDKWQACKEA